jgi:hypothetical protein
MSIITLQLSSEPEQQATAQGMEPDLYILNTLQRLQSNPSSSALKTEAELLQQINIGLSPTAGKTQCAKNSILALTGKTSPSDITRADGKSSNPPQNPHKGTKTDDVSPIDLRSPDPSNHQQPLLP